VPDQAIGGQLPLLAGQGRHQVALDLHRVGLGGQPEAVGQPGHVGVDHHPDGHAQGRRQDDVGGLARDPRQRHQGVEVGRHLAAVALDQGARHADQAPGLGAVEPRPEDQRLELGRLGDRQGRGVGVAGEQRRGQGVDHLVGRLRRQDRRAQELEGVGVIELAGGIGPGLGQAGGDRGDAVRRRRREGRGRPRAVIHDVSPP
jgi:hypothetical protein